MPKGAQVTWHNPVHRKQPPGRTPKTEYNVVVMKVEITTSKQNECTGSLTIENQWDHRKIAEIVVAQQGHNWSGGKLAQAARAQAEKMRRDMQRAAQSDPELLQSVLAAEQAARELEASLEEDPNDSQCWDETQRQMRAEARAEKAREIFGADLPGAHRRLVEIINDHANVRTPGHSHAANVPYELPLNDDAILVLGELGKAWLKKNADQLPPLGKRPSEQEDKAFLDANPEAGSLRELSKIFGELDKAAGQVRMRQLEKIRVRTKTKTRSRAPKH